VVFRPVHTAIRVSVRLHPAPPEEGTSSSTTAAPRARGRGRPFRGFTRGSNRRGPRSNPRSDSSQHLTTRSEVLHSGYWPHLDPALGWVGYLSRDGARVARHDRPSTPDSWSGFLEYYAIGRSWRLTLILAGHIPLHVGHVVDASPTCTYPDVLT